MPLSVSIYEIEQLLKKINYAQALLKLQIEDGNYPPKTVMIREIQTEPLGQNFRHLDLYELDMKRKQVVTVPVVTTGVSKGVEDGGILQIIRRELDVQCLPSIFRNRSPLTFPIWMWVSPFMWKKLRLKGMLKFCMM